MANTVGLEKVVELIDRLDRMRRNAERMQLVRKSYDLWGDGDLYPLIRLLMPGEDRLRAVYGVREAQLARLYSQVFALSPEQRKKLGGYRRGGRADFSEHVEEMARVRLGEQYEPAAGGSGVHGLTVKEANNLLDDLHRQRNLDERARILLRVVHRMSPRVHGWIARVLTRRFISAAGGEKVVLGALHDDALDLFRVTSDLRLVCDRFGTAASRQAAAEGMRSIAAHEPHAAPDSAQEISGREEGRVQFGYMVQPMLAARADLSTASAMVAAGGGEIAAEVKFDGERLQVHVARLSDGSLELRAFSRSGGEATARYRAGLEGPLRRGLRVSSAVLDGELLLYDEALGGLAPFGALRSVGAALDGAGADQRWLCFVAFDLLWVNGRDVMSRPLAERRSLLADAFVEEPHRLELAEQRLVPSAAALATILDEAMERGDEGVMLKDRRSSYRPGGRGDSWRKLKPDYVNAFADPLDLVVLGGKYGRGRRGGDMGSFWVGVRLDQARERYVAVARVGSGVNDTELEYLRDRLRPLWRPFDARRPPDFLAWALGEEAPDMVVSDPSRSILLAVIAGQFVPSTQYHSRLTLRFPRVQSIRSDKPVAEVLTLGQFQALAAQDPLGARFARGRATGSQVDPDTATSSSSSKKRSRSAAGDSAAVGHSKAIRVLTGCGIHAADEDDGEGSKSSQSSFGGGWKKLQASTTSSLPLQGLVICVLQTDGPKAAVERAAIAAGASIVQNVSAAVHLVVADRATLRVQPVLESGKWDVVTSKWVRTALTSGVLPLLVGPEVLFVRDSTLARMVRFADEHGDQYTVDVTPEGLQKLMDDMPMPEEDGAEEGAKLEKQAIPEEMLTHVWWRMFSECSVYLDLPISSGNSPSVLLPLRHTLRFFGARVLDQLDEHVSHVVVDNSASRDHVVGLRHAITSVFHRTGRRIHLVNRNWISDSVREGDLLAEPEYGPRPDRRG